MQALWELVQTIFVITMLGSFFVNSLWAPYKTKKQDRKQAEQQQQQLRPQPQPKRVAPKPSFFKRKPKPVPILAENAEPLQGEVVFIDTPVRRSSEYFQEEVAKMGAQTYIDYPMTWWAGPEKKVFMMTAMGRDNRHHAANAFLLGFQPFETDKMWVPLQTIATRLKYRYDEKQFQGMRDLWQTSKQAYYWLRGDCEDHALLLADWLIEMGYDARVVTGMHGKEGHAWVVLLAKGKTYLLEATSKRRRQTMPLAASLPKYKPEYMFNRQNFWVNTGSLLTSNYTDSKWQRRSIFTASY